MAESSAALHPVYESPHHLSATLEKLKAACGEERRVAVAKELTKVYERVFHGSLARGLRANSQGEAKGEYVIIVGGAETIRAEITDEEVDCPAHGIHPRRHDKKRRRNRGV